MAVASDVDICNMALDHLGKPGITALNEPSNEARKCAVQYPIARRIMLCRSPWTFARKTAYAAPVTDDVFPDQWEYAYDLPNDMLKLIRPLAPGEYVDPASPVLPSHIENGSIYANVEELRLMYVRDTNDTLSWSPLFDDAVALYLAARLAPSMTRRSNDAERLRQMATDALGDAVELDASLEPSRYTFYEGGYIDARGSGRVYGEGRMTDGSTIWGS